MTATNMGLKLKIMISNFKKHVKHLLNCNITIHKN